MGVFVKFNSIAAAFGAALVVPFCHAAAAGSFTALNAPDALSRAILAAPVSKPDQGAATPAEIPMAIHRNFPRIVEQNVAAMTPAAASAWLDQLGDLELEHLAQLYVTANASDARSGKLLQVAAARLDGARLGRLSRFFGYAGVQSAIAKAAPAKLADFESNTATSFEAPRAGTPLRTPAMVAAGAAPEAAVPMAAFTPTTSMTFEELYAGFRGMQVGTMAVAGAIYETAAWSGKNLITAWTIGYTLGTGITDLMIEYEPGFYYGQFVPWVGNSIVWLQGFGQSTWNDLWAHTLGTYQATTLSTFGVPSSQTGSMGSMGGDWGSEADYESYENGTNGDDCHVGTCPTRPER
jgi:hypothetical protein